MKSALLYCAAISSILAAMPSWCLAETQALSTEPPVLEFQYQLNYPRQWGFPGPGLTLGGSIPGKGREGISSFYGAPFPTPMGAGVYVNPFGYAARLPGPFSFGLAQSSPNQQDPGMNAPGMNVPGMNTPGVDPSILQAAGANGGANPSSIPPLQQTKQPIGSSAELIRRCREIELTGDAHFKDQNWNQAVVNYRNAVMTCPDRAEAYYRLGLANAMLESFPEAASALSRAISMNPNLLASRSIVDEILGSEKRAIPNEIVMNAATWAKGDLQRPERLLVLGAVLQCARDSRSDEILAAATRFYGQPDRFPSQMMSNAGPRPMFSPAAAIQTFPR